MSEALDRLKARQRGQRGVVTKYVQEAKSLLDAKSTEPEFRHQLSTLYKLLEEKQGILKVLDNDIVAGCPTEEMEWEIQEAEEVYEKIVESLATIDNEKIVLAVSSTDTSPGRGKHLLAHELSVPCDDDILPVHTNSSKLGAPAVA